MSHLAQYLWFLAANMPSHECLVSWPVVSHEWKSNQWNSVHSPDNVFQPLVLQQTKPAEMDWFGEAAEETAGQVRAGADRLLWGGALRVVCYPVTTRDNQVKMRTV